MENKAGLIKRLKIKLYELSSHNFYICVWARNQTYIQPYWLSINWSIQFLDHLNEKGPNPSACSLLNTHYPCGQNHGNNKKTEI